MSAAAMGTQGAAVFARAQETRAEEASPVIEKPGLISAVPAALLSLALVCLPFLRGTLPGRSQGRPFNQPYLPRTGAVSSCVSDLPATRKAGIPAGLAHKW